MILVFGAFGLVVGYVLAYVVVHLHAQMQTNKIRKEVQLPVQPVRVNLWGLEKRSRSV